ncbi:chromosomal replication initiator protein DnaA [Kingella oralis]|uniref:chromosomal replication initiator protein DnaA n=1 Tax=Kingella oralis TaxID=505 RepID=UPI002D7E2796|nr:chromosomal replication initiator protein DnaA [Kingella oralis]
MRLSEFWSQCLALLQSELSEQQFSRDIAPITVGEQDGAWVLFAKNQFAANLLRTQYASKIRKAAALIAPDAPELRFQIGVGEQVAIAVVPTDVPTDLPTDTASPADNAEGSLKTSAASATPAEAQTESKAEAARNKNKSAQDIIAERMSNLRPAKKTDETQPESQTTAAKPSAIAAEQAREAAEQRLHQTNLSPDYTFETLVEGKGNQLAANVAKSIAEKPGDSMYNPFFVYGSTGLGKTHLVQAIGNELLRLNPKAKVRYMHSDEYLKTFMATVRNKTWDTFKQQYLHYNLLIIDDIQFISGKDRTMEEFFFLFEHFHSRDQQIILTCDQLPSSLEDMDKRLVSRFSWGMTIRLEPPELEMRVDILERKAQAAGIMLEEDAATFIAQNVKQNVRELEGALNRVIARCRFSKKSVIDIDLAADALQDIVASNYKPITVELIMKAVADHYHISIRDILGKKRSRNLARPRQIAMAITKELTNLSLPAIGDAFGGRDHTTVMHAVKTIAKLRQDEPELKQDYEKLLIVIQH